MHQGKNPFFLICREDDSQGGFREVYFLRVPGGLVIRTCVSGIVTHERQALPTVNEDLVFVPMRDRDREQFIEECLNTSP